MPSRVVMIYCGSGPYRHISRLLKRDANAWFPWHYHRRRVSGGTELGPGSEIELWEVDDSRDPKSARFLSLGRIDFAQVHLDSVSFTVNCFTGEPDVSEEEVIATVLDGQLVFTPAKQLERDSAGVVLSSR